MLLRVGEALSPRFVMRFPWPISRRFALAGGKPLLGRLRRDPRRIERAEVFPSNVRKCAVDLPSVRLAIGRMCVVRGVRGVDLRLERRGEHPDRLLCGHAADAGGQLQRREKRQILGGKRWSMLD